MSDADYMIASAARQAFDRIANSTDLNSALRDTIPGYVPQAWQQAAFDVSAAADAHARPSAVYRPRVFMDGDKWCALYGENLQDGVAGFGDSVADAMADFDKGWAAPLKVGGATPGPQTEGGGS